MMFDWENECKEGRRSRMGGGRGDVMEEGEMGSMVWKRGGMEGVGWRVWYVTKQ